MAGKSLRFQNNITNQFFPKIEDQLTKVGHCPQDATTMDKQCHRTCFVAEQASLLVSVNMGSELHAKHHWVLDFSGHT